MMVCGVLLVSALEDVLCVFEGLLAEGEH
jgi:hypothetical protein